MPTASLPWYDLAEVRDAHDEFWAAVAERLRAAGMQDVPSRLDRERPYDEAWHQPDLLLGQACGFDAVHHDPPPLQLVATPHFDFEGCQQHDYRSFVVVRDDSGLRTLPDLRGQRCAINGVTSHSGANSLRSLVAPLHRDGTFFGAVVHSGAHEASLQMLHRDDADVAAIDCITFGLLRRHRPDALAGLRIIAETEPVAAPPYVTHASTPAAVVELLRLALAAAVDTLQPALRQTLGICAVTPLDVTAYAPIAKLAAEADALGYREMCPRDPASGMARGRCVA